MTRTGSARDGWAVISCLLLCFVCLNRIQTNNTTTLAPLIECLLFSRSAFCFQPPENNLMAGQRDSGCFSCLSAKTSAGAVECFPSAGEGALPTSLAPNQTCRAVPKRSLSSNPWPERAAAAAERPHAVPETRLSNAGVFFLSPSQKPGDVVMQRDGDVFTLYHEGFFWRCSFGGQPDGENLLWKLLFSKSEEHKEVQSKQLFFVDQLCEGLTFSSFLYQKSVIFFANNTVTAHIKIHYIIVIRHSTLIWSSFDPRLKQILEMWKTIYINLQRPSVRSMATDANKQLDTVLKGFING